jgi:hypothetical protein
MKICSGAGYAKQILCWNCQLTIAGVSSAHSREGVFSSYIVCVCTYPRLLFVAISFGYYKLILMTIMYFIVFFCITIMDYIDPNTGNTLQKLLFQSEKQYNQFFFYYLYNTLTELRVFFLYFRRYTLFKLKVYLEFWLKYG